MPRSFDLRHVLSSICRALHVDALVISSKDPHQLEFPLSQFKFRHFFSSFEGSAGTLIVYHTKNFFKCALWTDGRYEAQLKTNAPNGIEVKIGKETHWEPQMQWLASCHASCALDRDLRVAVCDLQMSVRDYMELKTITDTQPVSQRFALQVHAIPYKTFLSVVSTCVPSIVEYLQTPESLEEVVSDALRPYINTAYSLRVLQRKLCDNARLAPTVNEDSALSSRYNMLSESLRAHNVQCYLSANPFELAWLTDARSLALRYIMVFPSVFIFNRQDCTLTIWMPHYLCSSHSMDMFQNLDAHTHYTTTLENYDELLENTLLDRILRTHSERSVAYDSSNIPYALHHASFMSVQSPLLLWKSIRTDTEAEMMKYAQQMESIALCEAMSALAEAQKKKTVTEQEMHEYIHIERKKTQGYIQPSFNSIIASGAHAAYPHYMNVASSSPIHDARPLLIDTGAHYSFGTTDISRVFFLPINHDPPPLLIEDYTLVLKAHIQLALYTSTTVHNGESDYPDGRDLDKKARKTLQSYKRDYNHGTGHGVGYCSDVHEGVHMCSPTSEQKIFPNMIMSNEPGYYRIGRWGIRLENVVRAYLTTTNQLAIETITYFPFQNSLIDNALLSTEELAWLDAYQEKCTRIIYPALSTQSKVFFKTLLQ